MKRTADSRAGCPSRLLAHRLRAALRASSRLMPVGTSTHRGPPAMSAGRVCSRVVVMAAAIESVRTAAWRMAEQDVGALIVLDGVDIGQAIGLITHREIAMRCVAADLDPDTTLLSEIMVSPVHIVDQSAPLEDAVERMAVLGINRLVVTDANYRAVGVLSLDDILDVFVREVAGSGPMERRVNPDSAST